MAYRNSEEAWAGRVMLVGTAINVVNGLILILNPQWLFGLLGLPSSNEPQQWVWVQHTGLIIIGLGLMYLQAGLAPLRNVLLYVTSVAARFAGVVYFTIACINHDTWGYWPVILIDGGLFVLQAVMLSRAHRAHLASLP